MLLQLVSLHLVGQVGQVMTGVIKARFHLIT